MIKVILCETNSKIKKTLLRVNLVQLSLLQLLQFLSNFIEMLGGNKPYILNWLYIHLGKSAAYNFVTLWNLGRRFGKIFLKVLTHNSSS